MERISRDPPRAMSTSLGLLAVLFWASTVAFSRVAVEAAGYFTTAAILYLAAGLLSCAWAVARGRFMGMLRQPRRYLLACGALFVLYTLCFYGAIALAADRQVAIEVALVNYLWPALVLLLSVPLLGSTWSWLLLSGAGIALTGTLLAAADAHGLSAGAFARHVSANGLAFACGLVAALSWGLYSNLSRRWGRPDLPGGVPLFLLATGAILGAVRVFRSENAEWTPVAIGALAYLCVFPTTLAYVFWDAAMRAGDFALVGASSYLTPILSTAVSCTVLGTRPGPLLWVGALLVAAGAVVCRRALGERGGRDSAS